MGSGLIAYFQLFSARTTAQILTSPNLACQRRLVMQASHEAPMSLLNDTRHYGDAAPFVREFEPRYFFGSEGRSSKRLASARESISIKFITVVATSSTESFHEVAGSCSPSRAKLVLTEPGITQLTRM